VSASRAVTVEICTDSLAGVHAAAAGGADRVELCSALGLGGLTPGPGLLRLARAVPGLALVVLVRPRPGDFLYDTAELRTLAAEIERAGEAGADGVALGVLTADGHVDTDATARLIEGARPMEVCFHRAFDLVADPLDALEQLAQLGVERVLTSGGARDVVAGLQRLVELTRAAGERLTVMPGGGVRPTNVARVLAATGARAVHASARGARRSAMTHRNPEVVFTPGGDDVLDVTDPERVAALVAALPSPPPAGG